MSNGSYPAILVGTWSVILLIVLQMEHSQNIFIVGLSIMVITVIVDLVGITAKEDLSIGDRVCISAVMSVLCSAAWGLVHLYMTVVKEFVG